MKKRVQIEYKHTEILFAMIFLCAVNTAMMYLLCKSHMFICTLIMTAITSGMYWVFHKLRRRRVISFLVFTAIFISICLMNGFVSTIFGPIEMIRFIFTTSNYFDPLLAAASIWMFSLIFTYPVTYFTEILPRPGFLMLIVAIPIMLGARTTGGLPIGILAFMMAGFILASAGVSRPEIANGVTYYSDKSARFERIVTISAASLLALIAILVVPINEKTPMGQYMESLLLYRGNISFGTQTISQFEERTESNNGYRTPSTDVVFVAAADFPYKVTRETYDVYEGEDGWTKSDSSLVYQEWETYRALSVPRLIRNLKIGVNSGKLQEYKSALDKVEIGESGDKSITIRFVDNSSGHVVLHPSKTYEVTLRNYRGNVFRGTKDEVWTDKDYGTNPSYNARFYADTPNEEFIAMFEDVNFSSLLYDAYMEGVISLETYQAYTAEYEVAHNEYLQTADNGITPQIKQLADQITEGLSNDYEKALAIERWFANGYTYNIDYAPEEATAEYFLFTGKTGICTDFATATTLLLRASGIPARYTVGYQLKDDSIDVYGQYIVRENQAHAYTTAYIKGYGWLELDGTQYAPVAEENTTMKNMLLVLLIGVAVLGILAIVFRKQLGEAIFRISYRFRSQNGKIRAIYIRVRKLGCQISGEPVKSTTADEVRQTITGSLDLGEQASEIADAANELMYGNGNPTVGTKRLFDDYKAIYKAKRSRKK